MIDGQTWPVPTGAIQTARGWRVRAPAGHAEAGRTREFKATSDGELGRYLKAMDWYYARPSALPSLPIGFRLVRVEEMLLEVPRGVKRITQGWRAKRGESRTHDFKQRDFSDGGDPRRALRRAIAWRDGQDVKRIPSAPVDKRLRVCRRGPGRRRAWEQKDDLRMLYLFSEGASASSIATASGRTVRAVTQRAARLGYPRPSPISRRRDRSFAPDEDAIINAWVPVLPIGIVHTLFFRSCGVWRSRPEIGRRARELGITPCKRLPRSVKDSTADVCQRERLASTPPRAPARERAVLRRWTAREDAILHEYQGTIPLREIHVRYFTDGTGETRSYAAVAQRIGALGISLSRRDAALLALPKESVAGANP